MERRIAMRALAAGAAAAVGVAAALLLGAPLSAALLALLAGVAAYALAPAAPDAAAAAAPDEAEADALPGMADLLRAVDEPMLVVRERRVIAANAAARALLGEHIEGSDVRLAIRHPAAAERLGAAADEGQARVELVGLGEADRQWAMTLTPLPDGSRLVRLSDQSQMRALEQMRIDFVANASHELRTPLATLLGFLETLQDEETAADAETRTRFLKIMFDEASRMRDLVQDLMSLSRIEAERFAAPSEPVDLEALAQSVAAELAPLAQSRDSQVLVEKDAERPIVPGDSVQLAQLLRNLVSNALNYGKAGTPVRIRIEESGGAMLRLRVIDQGPGIAPEHIPRLTERFYRVDPGRSRAVGGTGLGLAIAKHVALRHRGRLEIVSKLGEGTSVRVYLPRASGGGGENVTETSSS